MCECVGVWVLVCLYVCVRAFVFVCLFLVDLWRQGHTAEWALCVNRQMNVETSAIVATRLSQARTLGRKRNFYDTSETAVSEDSIFVPEVSPGFRPECHMTANSLAKQGTISPRVARNLVLRAR